MNGWVVFHQEWTALWWGCPWVNHSWRLSSPVSPRHNSGFMLKALNANKGTLQLVGSELWEDCTGADKSSRAWLSPVTSVRTETLYCRRPTIWMSYEYHMNINWISYEYHMPSPFRFFQIFFRRLSMLYFFYFHDVGGNESLRGSTSLCLRWPAAGGADRLYS